MPGPSRTIACNLSTAFEISLKLIRQRLGEPASSLDVAVPNRVNFHADTRLAVLRASPDGQATVHDQRGAGDKGCAFA
jgi:hypothetical protein